MISANLHISLTAFRNESRVLKEVHSVIKHGVAETVQVAALHEEGLPEEENISKNIKLTRFRLSSRPLPKNILAQAAKYIEFAIRVGRFYRKRGIKMVNIHALGLLPLGVLLKYLYDAMLIYDTHELETETNGSKGFRKILSKTVERIFIRFAEQTFVVSEAIANEYARMYKMKTPPVILNCPNYTPPVQSNLFREHLDIPADAVIFLYQGGLSSGRGVTIILEAFKKLADPKKVVVFMGYGPLEKEIKEASLNFDNIYFHPAVPPEAVLQYTASADIGMHFIQNTCLNHYYCMPNKLFEYMMAGLPVIVSNMYEMDRFVKKYGTGVVVRDESPAAIDEAINKLMKMDLTSLKYNALEAAKQFCWEEQEKIMVTAYSRLFSGGRS